MTNYEKFMSMNIEEFAKLRITYDPEWGEYQNDIEGNVYVYEKDAIQDEIEWLKQEVK